MSTAYAYIRYSSKAQGEAGRDSVDRQMTSIQAVTKQHGIELRPENIYSDTGVSGFDGSNSRKGKLKDLVDLILSEKIQAGDFVFVESLDRLSRQKMRLSKDLVYSILDRGVTLVTTIDGQIYSRAKDGMEQDILLTVIAQRAHEESKTKSIRRKSAWNRAKSLAESEKVIFNGHNTPYGISYNKEENRFEIVEEEAKEIIDIFENLKFFGVSMTIKKVNEYSKRKWTNKNIQHLLENKYVLGTYMSQKRDENKKKVFDRYIENYYPQIVTYELFQSAVSAMKSRAAKRLYGGHTVGSLNIFRHVIKCDGCGASMLFEKSKNYKGVIYPYFHCFTRRELKNGCDMPRFRFDLAFGTLLHLVKYATSTIDEMLIDLNLEKLSIFNNSNFKDRSVADLMISVDEEFKKENDKDNQTINEISNSVSGFQKTLFKLLTSTDKDKEINSKIKKMQEELDKNKTELSNLEKSCEKIESGIIPSSLLNRMSDKEQKIREIEQELGILNTESFARQTTLSVHSYKDIIELYETEEGRLKLNQFFTSNEIEFRFAFETKTRTLKTKIYYKDKLVDRVNERFDLHNPLKKFGIDNLNEYFNE
ncbi:TPA: recombinase family protein [Pseudomonas aeruginosa]